MCLSEGGLREIDGWQAGDDVMGRAGLTSLLTALKHHHLHSRMHGFHTSPCYTLSCAFPSAHGDEVVACRQPYPALPLCTVYPLELSKGRQQ